LKKEFLITETWAPFQLRPWTPAEGIPFATLFPCVDIKGRYASLNRAGEPFGLKFGDRTFLSNSKPALEAGEYARDQGKFEVFHEHVFRAYFTDLLDIGDTAVLLRLAQDVGLDPGELKEALEEERYRMRIEESMNDAARVGVTAVPTFLIEDVSKIVGAQPLKVFRDQLLRL
jgi:predicted DsbA family dithiol-disulfide isomerase